jgi:hypothetical protein
LIISNISILVKNKVERFKHPTKLFNWIHTTWTTKCEISLCSKGFFIVCFHNHEEYQKIREEGPWFWGREGLFNTPWHPYFDPNKMSVTTTPVWVRLINFLLHFWSHQIMIDIGNKMGKHLKIDLERARTGLTTYACICVQMDISKGLLDKLILKWNSHKWIQILDYENTTFRCKICQKTGHLHGSFPFAFSPSLRTKGPKSKPKILDKPKQPIDNDLEEEKNSLPPQENLEKKEDSKMEGKDEVQHEDIQQLDQSMIQETTRVEKKLDTIGCTK